MTTAEKLIQQGIEEGLEQGLERGLEQGLERGLEQGLERGLERGLEQGLERGRAEERRDLLLRLVESRFGDPSPSQSARIRSASADELTHWIDRLLSAGSLDELLA